MGDEEARRTSPQASRMKEIAELKRQPGKDITITGSGEVRPGAPWRRAPGGAQIHIPSPELRKWQTPLRGHGRPEEPGVRGHDDVEHGRPPTKIGANLTNKKDGLRRNLLKDSK